jgi:hypothetical protein
MNILCIFSLEVRYFDQIKTQHFYIFDKFLWFFDILVFT